jgi:serine phosphatase RsbU (regulator of sigma subunit)
LDLGDCYYGIGKPDKAVFYGRIGLSLSQRYRSIVLQERAHYLLSNNYAALDQNASALRHYKSFVALRDRISQDARSRQLTEMRLRYENEKIGKEIAVLTREKRIQVLDLARKQNLIWTGLGVIALLGLIALILQRKNQIERSTNTKLHEINTKIEQQRDQIEVQKAGLKDALGQLESSIQYAKRIQDAILSASAPLEPMFHDPLTYFRPKAIVSGDFYWVSHEGDETVLVVADCTGHGVPGAFLSLVGHATLVRALSNVPDLDPAQILSFIDGEISRILGNQPGLDLKEGIEMSICVLNRTRHVLRFAGARRDAFIVTNTKVETANGSRRSVGGVYARQAPEHWRFETKTFALEPQSALYQLSDGFTDQHGADGKSKFGLPRLRNLLKEIAPLPAKVQSQRLDAELVQWRGETEQTDDILIVGLRMS